MLNLEKKLKLDESVWKGESARNLVGRFSDADRLAIANYVWEGFEQDRQSRFNWEKRMQAGMDLALQMAEAKNFPWPGCSNVVFPLITIAALQFSAKSYPNIIQGTNVVRYRTIGKAEGTTVERASRIGRHMSWQVLEEDEGWEEQHDKLLINLSIVGVNFTKTYWSSRKGYTTADLVLAKDLYMDYFSKSVKEAFRKTHRLPLYRNEMRERMLRKVFWDYSSEPWFISPSSPQQVTTDEDRRKGLSPPPAGPATPFYLLEQHTWLDLDGDGYEEPYIVTIEESSRSLLRIVARWEDEKDIEYTADGKVIKIKPIEHFDQYTFIPSPDGGVYGLGFGLFLGPINEAVNALINQVIDGGTFQNSIGGFLGRGAKIRGGVYTMAPWEWKRVDSTGDDLKKNLVPFPERQISDVLFKLLGLLVEYANRIAGTTDPMVGENPGQNTPASTFQGMTEMGMQIYSVIFKRVWRAMKEEFKTRYLINSVYLDEQQDFGFAKDFIRKEDYLGSPNQIAPVANPRVTSTLMRFQRATMVKQSAMGTPGYDIYETEVDWLEALEYEDIDRIYPGPGKVPQGHEASNPKAAVEMLKLQGKQMELQARKQEWANHLLETKRLNNAKIALLEAQAMKAAADANAERAALMIELFDREINMHKELSKSIDDHIKALGGEYSGESRSDGTGVQGVEGAPDNSGNSRVSVEVPGGSEVSVGGGSVQQ